MIRDRLVIGIAYDQTRKKLLEKKKLSLGEALDICRDQEQATMHAKEMSSTENRVDRMQSGFKWKTPKRDNKVLPLSTEDRLDLSKIINAMETFCIGERNEVFESYTFHKRNQKLGEIIDAYFTDLNQMAKNAIFKTKTE